MNWVFLVLLSAVLLATSNILIKKALQNKRSLSLLFYVSLISTLVMLFFHTKISFSLHSDLFFLLIIKSAVIAVALYCVFHAYKKLSISTVAPIKNLSPILLIFFSIFILQERVSTINYLGVLLLILSAYALEIPSIHHLTAPLKFFKSKYFVLLVVAMIGNSVSATLDKILVQSINYYTILFWFYLFMTIFYFVPLIAKKRGNELKQFANMEGVLFVLGITLFELFGDLTYMMAVALPTTAIILIIPLRRTYSFFATLVGGTLFKEKNILYKSGVCLVMILGVLLIAL